MSFTHLQVRSGYSFLDSTITIEKLIKKASDLDFKALALTDEEVLYGTIPFYKACLKHRIKPLIGMVVNVRLTTEEYEQCILYAKNNNGYQQLSQISTMIQKGDQQGIELDDLRQYTNDLLCILPVSASKLAVLLNTSSHGEAISYIEEWRLLFGQEDFYLGIESYGLANEQQLHEAIKIFHQSTQIPVVAINDVRYLNEQDDIAFDCLRGIKDGAKWEQEDADQTLKNRHLRSIDEMNDLFSSFWPEVLQKTEEIEEKCVVTFDFDTNHMPSFPVPGDYDAHTYLEELCFEKVYEKFEHVTSDVTKRLNDELRIIASMEFSDYFLIVSDYIAFAKENNILVGPGRGSAAGSIVAYVLGITDVDPLKYNLLFERFLNPERHTMPDIDVDFSDHRRDEVIEYVRKKYGEEHVAQIITFGTFGARSLLRELFKTMEIDERDVQFILSKIPSQAHQSIATYVKASEDLVAYIKQSKKLRLLFTIATKLEGLPRHMSTHAAGVIISEQPLLDYIPLTKGAKGNLTQFPMNDLEAIGLLKMDFLGLRNLTFLERIVQSIKFSTNQNLNLNHLPDDDLKTYELLQKGKTNGVFQLESGGMKQVLTRLKPTSFEDIVAVNALYRPGPMDFIQTYIDRKHGKEQVTYLHPDIEPILNRTYGVLVYQEQIMQIAHVIAGFTLGEADVLRRAISKKESELMEEQRNAFIQGCVNNGYDSEIAHELFLWIVKFSNYGFNRSHAVAYSKISYQLAFLKANYPQHFFAELLSSVSNQEDKVYQYIKESQELQLNVLPPSINKSFGKYSVEGGKIRMGLLSIKGVSHQIVKEIIRIRKEQPFTDLFDFCLRSPLDIINRNVLELLIKAGAFDETYSNRASLLASIDQAIDQAELFGDLTLQPSLLPNKLGIEERYTDIEDFTTVRKLSDEKELLGIYVSSHPLKEYRRQLRTNGYVSLQNEDQLVGKKRLQTAVIVQSIKKIRTKRGDPMAFITIGDEYGDMEAVVFPELFRQVGRWLEEEMMIFATGNIETRNNRIQWLFQEMKPFDDHILKESDQRLFIQLVEVDHEQALVKLKEIASTYPGDTSIIIYHKKSKNTYQLTNGYDLTVNDQSLRMLNDYFGKVNVVLEK